MPRVPSGPEHVTNRLFSGDFLTSDDLSGLRARVKDTAQHQGAQAPALGCSAHTAGIQYLSTLTPHGMQALFLLLLVSQVQRYCLHHF